MWERIQGKREKDLGNVGRDLGEMGKDPGKSGKGRRKSGKGTPGMWERMKEKRERTEKGGRGRRESGKGLQENPPECRESPRERIRCVPIPLQIHGKPGIPGKNHSRGVKHNPIPPENPGMASLQAGKGPGKIPWNVEGKGRDIPGPIPRKKRSREGSEFRECSWIPFSTFPVIPAFPDAFGWDFGNSIPVPFVHPGIIESREKKFRPDSRSDPSPPRILGFGLGGFPGNAAAGMPGLGKGWE